MYEIGDAITGTGVQQAPADMPPEQIKQSWLEYFNRPEVQAGLLQFGAQALQPVPIGQTAAGHFGQALTSGMQAAGRIASQEDERKRAAAQEAKLEAEAARAEAQAAQEGERATLAREGMQVDRERLQADKDYRQTSLQLEREKMAHAAELEKSRQAAAYSVAKLVHGADGKVSEYEKTMLKTIGDSATTRLMLASTPEEAAAILAETESAIGRMKNGLPATAQTPAPAATETQKPAATGPITYEQALARIRATAKANNIPLTSDKEAEFAKKLLERNAK